MIHLIQIAAVLVLLGVLVYAGSLIVGIKAAIAIIGLSIVVPVTTAILIAWISGD